LLYLIFHCKNKKGRILLTKNIRDSGPNQLEAINATLSGQDLFVLVPIGRGENLCYQLSTIIQRVTSVIFPLLSLMQDQVEQLVTGKGIAAGMLNSTVSNPQTSWVYSDLRKNVPQTRLMYYQEFFLPLFQK
jgi:superfamily II DNA helicase RecQ